MFRKRKKAEKEYLLDGVWSADTILLQQSEPRILTLLLKALIVYCLVAGGIGSVLSALNVDYHVLIVQLVLLAASILFVLLYYNHIIENLGYILILVLMVMGGYLLRNYISSGFYGVMNELGEEVSRYFKSDVIRSYGEQISNRPLAVTVSMCYIGIVCCLIINILVSRKMRYLMIIMAITFCLFMPLYLELEPELFYVLQFLWGVFLTYMIHRSKHYKLETSDRKYKRNKHTYSYIYSIRTMSQASALLVAVILIVLIFLSILFPKDDFHERYPAGAWKKQTGETVENLAIVGIAGLFNFYDNVGGLTSGRLGGVSAIRLDYQTDLTLTFVPTSMKRFYLRQFVGGKYQPVRNRWESVQNISQQTEEAICEAYTQGSDYIGQGQIQVDNVGGKSGLYLPYYSMDADKAVWVGRSQTYTYYNTDYMYTDENKSLQVDWNLESSKELYLDVPIEDAEAVDQTIALAKMDDSLSLVENVSRLKKYYAENIPYSYRPGVTPYGKDFVHYFLLENRRGYCAHFASAATLIFRRLGIPARYVEGYAVDPEDIGEEGKALLDASAEEYHQGYTEIDQSGVVRVNVLDADAHAWVEVWSDGTGWRVVDITPASLESGGGQSLSNILMRLFGNVMNGEMADSAGTANILSDTQDFGEVTQSLLKIIGGLIAFIAILFCFVPGIRFLYGRFRYADLGRNDKLVHSYQRYVRKMEHDVNGLSERINYEEQIELLQARGKLHMGEGEKRRFLSIMERAGFGSTEISEEEDAWLRERLK
ncbi:MAG: hypothetical protein J1F02_01775 [Lachnospiraceae bacterium]|nr:hypothetical protein [Lachnospiraceae bacterium]